MQCSSTRSPSARTAGPRTPTRPNQFVADRMAEIESVSARKATLLNPTEEDETVQVLRRRLFEHVDDTGAGEVIDAYRGLWAGHREAMADEAARPETVEQFRAGYPLHPHVLETLTGKTATPLTSSACAGCCGYSCAPSLTSGGCGPPKQRPCTASHRPRPRTDPAGDRDPPRAGLVRARHHQRRGGGTDGTAGAGRGHRRAAACGPIFMHTLAFSEPLKGLTADELRYTAAGPAVDPSFIDAARITTESIYLDDRPAVPTQIPGRGQPERGDPARGAVRGRRPVRRARRGGRGPPEAGRVRLWRPRRRRDRRRGPELVERVYSHKCTEGSGLRARRNHLVFLAPDEHAADPVRRRMRLRLDLLRPNAPDRLDHLAKRDQERIRDLEARSEQEFAIAIQRSCRHVFHPWGTASAPAAWTWRTL